MSNLVNTHPEIVNTHPEIAARAYQLWEERGCPIGSPEEDWFLAEAELTQKVTSAAA